MSDKFRQTFPIALTFTEGELPAASKFNALATQSRSGQTLLQYALGDVWNQAGDNMLAPTGHLIDNALMIPNLARFIGATKQTSPRIPYLSAITKYTHVFASSDVNKYESVLAFPPVDASTTYTWTSAGTKPTNGTSQASRDLVNATGKFYVDIATGEVYTYDPILADWKVTYAPVVKGDINDTATFNVIPDLNTHSSYQSFMGLKIEYVNGSNNLDGYYIYLPPRMPLSDNRTGTVRAPSTDILNFGDPASSASGIEFWQTQVTASIDATLAPHYRYVLPVSLTGTGGWLSGATVPEGMLYLWDPVNTGTIIDGVTFTAEVTSGTVRKWVLFVPYKTQLDTWITQYGGTAYPTSRLQDTTHIAANYPSTGLKLIVVGSDIASYVSSLMLQFLNHDHGSANSLPSKPVAHSKATGLFAPGSSPELTAPPTGTWPNDDHPQYLNRRGYSTTRDAFGNGMVGDLLMNSKSAPYGYQNIGASNSSYAIHFGRHDAAGTNDGIVQSGSRIFGWGLSDGGVPSQELVLDNYITAKGWGTIDIFDPDRTGSSQVQFRHVGSSQIVYLSKYGTGNFNIGTNAAALELYTLGTGSPIKIHTDNATTSYIQMYTNGGTGSLTTNTKDISIGAGGLLGMRSVGAMTIQSTALTSDLTVQAGKNAILETTTNTGDIYVTAGRNVVLNAINGTIQCVTRPVLQANATQYVWVPLWPIDSTDGSAASVTTGWKQISTQDDGAADNYLWLYSGPTAIGPLQYYWRGWHTDRWPEGCYITNVTIWYKMQDGGASSDILMFYANKIHDGAYVANPNGTNTGAYTTGETALTVTLNATDNEWWHARDLLLLRLSHRGHNGTSDDPKDHVYVRCFARISVTYNTLTPFAG